MRLSHFTQVMPTSRARRAATARRGPFPAADRSFRMPAGCRRASTHRGAKGCGQNSANNPGHGFFHLLIRTEENNFDGAVERMTFSEQRGERRAGPANVANGAHEPGLELLPEHSSVAVTVLRLRALISASRQCPRYLQEAGDFEFPVGAVHFGQRHSCWTW